jgi:hypothetical protein
MADSQQKIAHTLEMILNTLVENMEISRDLLDLIIKGYQQTAGSDNFQ